MEIRVMTKSLPAAGRRPVGCFAAPLAPRACAKATRPAARDAAHRPVPLDEPVVGAARPHGPEARVRRLVAGLPCVHPGPRLLGTLERHKRDCLGAAPARAGAPRAA